MLYLKLVIGWLRMSYEEMVSLSLPRERHIDGYYVTYSCCLSTLFHLCFVYTVQSPLVIHWLFTFLSSSLNKCNKQNNYSNISNENQIWTIPNTKHYSIRISTFSCLVHKYFNYISKILHIVLSLWKRPPDYVNLGVYYI